MDVVLCGELYAMLVETVKSIGGYKARRRYLVETLLRDRPTITLEEVMSLLGVSRGEGFVLLRESRLWCNEVEEEVSLTRFFEPAYSMAGIGGTFDRIHVGHIALINTAVRLAQRLYIGVTSDRLSMELGKTHPVDRLEDRLSSLEKILERYGWAGRCELGVLDDPLGPPAIDERFDLVVLSPFTSGRGEEINRERLKRGLRPVDVETCPLVLAMDGKPISSTRIRAGEVGPEGRVR